MCRVGKMGLKQASELYRTSLLTLRSWMDPGRHSCVYGSVWVFVRRVYEDPGGKSGVSLVRVLGEREGLRSTTPEHYVTWVQEEREMEGVVRPVWSRSSTETTGFVHVESRRRVGEGGRRTRERLSSSPNEG